MKPELLKPVPNHHIRKEREARGWTQEQLADFLQVSLDAVRSWESGRRKPLPPQRVRLCATFQLSPEQLGLLPAVESSSKVLCSQESLVEGKQEQGTLLEPLAHAGEGIVRQVKPFLPRRNVDENRQRMLSSVRSTWIEGVLQRSLSSIALIELGFVEVPDALENPWHLAVQETTGPARLLPTGTPIVQVYDEAQGELLILGEPGAGKTTLLLELARVLLNRAEQNEDLPIPVVFNLSSWAKHDDLVGWLLEELQSKYRVPRNLAQTWIEQERLTILLDGLDETSEDARPICVKAVSLYKQEHILVSLVICCRRKEYLEQNTRIALQRAVSVQPLTRDQIDEYLLCAEGQLDAVQKAVQEDSELEEMIRTPLMLSIIALTYQGNHADLALSGTKEDRRRQILRTYLQRMLTRRAVTPYDPQETIHRLSWLAKQMQTHSQSVFYLERVQPDWQTDSQSYRQYHQMVNRIFVAVTVLIFSGLLACFRGDFLPNVPGLFFWFGGGRGDSVLGWMAPGMGGGMPGATSLSLLFALVTILVHLLGDRRRIPTFNKKALRRAFLAGFGWGILIGGIIGVVSGIIFSRGGGFTCVGGTLSGVACGSSVGLFGGIIVGFQIALIALLRYDTRHLLKRAKQKQTIFEQKDRLLNMFLFGGCGFLGFVAIYSWQSAGINQLAIGYGLISGVYFGLVYNQGFEMGLVPELGITIQLAETAVWSWRAVRSHFGDNLKKGASLGGILLLCVVAIITSIASLFYGPAYGVRFGLIYGVVVAVISGVTGLIMGILTSGWSNDMLDERQLARPNEGTHRSLRNAVFAACMFGPIGGLSSGLLSALAFALGGVSGWPVLGVGLAFILTLACSYQIFMMYGGYALFEHYTLRWSLWRKGIIPWDTISFFDYTVERILMRKVGGGYMFIHRLLLEYFAEDEENKP
jgi:transcriptional regulator with XRE-family HTH domain/DNA polymerase III delta prime subunit